MVKPRATVLLHETAAFPKAHDYLACRSQPNSTEMPFFRENLDNDNVHPPAAEADLGPRPVPIHGLSQTRRHAPARSLAHRVSEESIRTDLCEGPLQEAPGGSKPRSPEPELCVTTTSDRAELIERLKRGESPTWVPNRRVRLQ